MRNPTVILDIGSSKVTGLLVDYEDREIRLLDWAQGPAEGFKEGSVSDLRIARMTLEQCLDQVSKDMEGGVSDLILLIVSPTLRGRERTESVSVGQISGVVQEAHLRSVKARIRTAMDLQDNLYQILSVHINQYEVDGIAAENPLGMRGSYLSAHAYVVYVQRTVLENLLQVTRSLGYRDPRFEAQAITASYGVLDPDLREQGVALVDIGKMLTQIAVWKNGALRYTQVLRMGGDLLTKEIQSGFQLSWAEAERLKQEHGVASPKFVEEGVELIPAVNRKGREIQISQVELAEAIEAKLTIMLRYLQGALNQGGLWKELTEGIVLVGGTAHLPYIDEYAAEVLKVPVQIGRPRGDLQVPWNELLSPAYASVLGALELLKRESEFRSQVFSMTDSHSAWRKWGRKFWEFLKRTF